MVDSNNDDLSLKAVSPRDTRDLLHVSTDAACGTIVAKIKDNGSVDKALCFTLQTQNPSEVYEPIGVYGTGDDNKAATVFFLEFATKKSFMTAYSDDIGRDNEPLKVQKYGFTSSSIKSVTA